MSSLAVAFAGGCGRKTVAAGTPITQLIQPRPGTRAHLDKFVYTPGANTHLLSVLQVQGRTTMAADAAAGQAVIVLSADPGAAVANALAANDWLVVKRPEGFAFAAQVVGAPVVVTGGIQVTLSVNLPVAIPAQGSMVWDMGAPGDTVPTTGEITPQFDLPTGATTTFDNASGNGLVASPRFGEPLLLHVDNVTAAGKINYAAWTHCVEGGGINPNTTLLEEGEEAPQEGQSAQESA
jgi:hypothetical protein